jgi:hypothetical protein
MSKSKKKKKSLCSINYAPCHEVIWELEVYLAIDGGKPSDSLPGRFTPMEFFPVYFGQETGRTPQPV